MPTSRIEMFDAAEENAAGENSKDLLPGVTQQSLATPLKGSLRLSAKRAVAVVFSNYPSDPRPRRAAEALVEEGASVEMICLKETDQQPLRETFNGVDITRIPLKRRRGGKLAYVLQYGSFIFLAGCILAGRTFKRRYDLVHVHNMPDVLVFSALMPKLFGAKVILDLHDPMPELMLTIFGLKEDSYFVQFLKALETLSIRVADAVLTTNEAFRKLFLARGCPAGKISVVMNSPDEKIFHYLESKPLEVSSRRDPSQPFVIMYHGSLVERHGLDLAVAALGKARQTIPEAELWIYGRSTPFLERVMDSAKKSSLAQAVRYLGPANLEKIAEAIRKCDVGIIPNQRSKFTELNMPTRIFEFLSQGKPVISPRTEGIMDYFGPDELVLFELGSAEDLGAKLQFVYSNPILVAEMVKRGQKIYKTHRWNGEQLRLIDRVEKLFGIVRQ